MPKATISKYGKTLEIEYDDSRTVPVVTKARTKKRRPLPLRWRTRIGSPPRPMGKFGHPLNGLFIQRKTGERFVIVRSTVGHGWARARPRMGDGAYLVVMVEPDGRLGLLTTKVIVEKELRQGKPYDRMVARSLMTDQQGSLFS